MVGDHLNPRFEHRVLNVLSADDMANLVREALGARASSQATISVILNVVGHVYRHASRRLGGPAQFRQPY